MGPLDPDARQEAVEADARECTVPAQYSGAGDCGRAPREAAGLLAVGGQPRLTAKYWPNSWIPGWVRYPPSQ